MENPAILHVLVAQIVLLFPGGPDVLLVSQAASLSDVSTVCTVEGGTAVFPWSLTLGPGETLNRINWAKSAPSSRDVLEVDSSGTQTQYDSRASTNGSAFLILENVTANDVGRYRCIVRIVGTAVRQEDEAELGLKNTELPDLEGVTVSARKDTSTSVTVQWSEVPVNATCDEVLTYYIEYKLDSSGSWEPAGSVRGSAYGNTTLTFTVTGLNTKGSYKFGITAGNSLGNSSRVEADNEDGGNSGSGDIWPWLVPVSVLVVAVGGATFTWWRMYKGLMKLNLRPLPGRKMEVKWTAPRGYERARYKVAFRPKDSKDWTRTDVSTNDPPNYKYTHTVTFPGYGSYQLCVFVKIDGEDEKNSDIEGVVIERSDDAASDRPNEPNMPVSPLHDNNTPKNDSHVVFMTTDGRSPPLRPPFRLDPIVNEQNPEVKMEKKKRKKVNKVNASYEETKPEV